MILLHVCVHAKSLQSCPAVCDPMDCSPPGSSIQVILQAKNTGMGCHALLWGSSQPRDWTHVSCLLHWQVGSLPLALSGKPDAFTYMDLIKDILISLFLLTLLHVVTKNWKCTYISIGQCWSTACSPSLPPLLILLIHLWWFCWMQWKPEVQETAEDKSDAPRMWLRLESLVEFLKILPLSVTLNEIREEKLVEAISYIQSLKSTAD